MGRIRGSKGQHILVHIDDGVAINEGLWGFRAIRTDRQIGTLSVTRLLICGRSDRAPETGDVLAAVPYDQGMGGGKNK